jgi:hypothetical protein
MRKIFFEVATTSSGMSSDGFAEAACHIMRMVTVVDSEAKFAAAKRYENYMLIAAVVSEQKALTVLDEVSHIDVGRRLGKSCSARSYGTLQDIPKGNYEDVKERLQRALENDFKTPTEISFANLKTMYWCSF